VPQPCRAEELDVDKAAKVKAGYLLNFVRYTQWPESAFEKPDSPIVITLVGSCDLENVLPDVCAKSEPVDGRRVEVQRASVEPGGDNAALFSSLDRSHLVYVCDMTPEAIRPVLDRVSGSRVLTVGDVPGFATSGGMLGFVLREGRIAFEANPEAIQKSPVTVSAKVLKLARIVGKEGPR
jgi:hypothetical protein